MTAIYLNGKIYENIDEDAEEFMFIENMKAGCMCDDCKYGWDYLKSRPSHPVLNSHNFKEGQEVVEGKDYEKRYQIYNFLDEWETTTRKHHDITIDPAKRRIVALPLHQSVQESLLNDRQKAMIWWNADAVGHKDNLTDIYFYGRHQSSLTGREIQCIWEKERPIPSPAPTTQGKDISAMQTLIEYIDGMLKIEDGLVLKFKDNKKAVEDIKHNWQQIQMVKRIATSLLAKEADQRRSDASKGWEAHVLWWENEDDTAPDKETFLTAHYSNTKQ